MKCSSARKQEPCGCACTGAHTRAHTQAVSSAPFLTLSPCPMRRTCHRFDVSSALQPEEPDSAAQRESGGAIRSRLPQGPTPRRSTTPQKGGGGAAKPSKLPSAMREGVWYGI